MPAAGCNISSMPSPLLSAAAEARRKERTPEELKIGVCWVGVVDIMHIYTIVGV